MKNLIDFPKMVETGVDPCLIDFASLAVQCCNSDSFSFFRRLSEKN